MNMNLQLGFQSNLYQLNEKYDFNDFTVFELDIKSTLDEKTDRYRILKEEIRILLKNNKIVSSYGHLIGFYKPTQQEIAEFNKFLKQNLANVLKIPIEEITLNELESSLWIQDENVGLNLLKQVIGHKITEYLKSKEFIKIESNKGAGRFKIPNRLIQQSSYQWELKLGKNVSYRYLDVGITIHNVDYQNKTFNALLLLDTVTKLEGGSSVEERISTLLNRKNISLETNPENWKKEIIKELGTQPIFKLVSNTEEETNELYVIEDIITANLENDLTFSYKQHRNKSMKFILEKLHYNSNSKWIIKVKDYRNKDPNVRHYWPCSIIVQKIDSKSLRDRQQVDLYNKFAKITPADRFNLVQEIIVSANFKEIIENNYTFEGHSYPFYTPFITNKYNTKIFGKFPRLTDSGVEKWGNLEELFVIWGIKSNIDKIRFDNFFNQVESTFRQIATKTGVTSPQITKLQMHSDDPNDYLEKIPKGKKVCLLLIGDSLSTYKEYKIQFTIKRDQAIQYIQRKTFVKMERRYPMLVETLARQILAKTGGLPYKLSQSNLPDTIIVGLDRARDTYNQKASASAGVAAVLPTGEYLTGISTKVDARKDDFITVDEVAPPFLKQLKRIKFQPKVAIILRDGSPATCKNEVPEWLKYLEKENIQLIFCASTKDHPYRVFPAFKEGKEEYVFPIGILNEPKDENDFMVLTTMPPPNSGTPKPGLYTLMKNTTEKSDEEVKKMLLSIITSMSILCWESPKPTSQPLPLHYADKLAGFTQLTEQAWNPENPYPMFI